MFNVKLYSQIFWLFVYLFLIVLVMQETNSWAQPSRTLASSPLLMTGNTAECAVANVSNREVSVSIEIISGLGSPVFSGDTNIPPNNVESFSTTLVVSGQEFFCKFGYSGNDARRIRGVARVIDTSTAHVVIQRAEAR